MADICMSSYCWLFHLIQIIIISLTNLHYFYYTGYQRQLNYKHHDGAYSAFGTGDGNTW